MHFIFFSGSRIGVFPQAEERERAEVLFRDIAEAKEVLCDEGGPSENEG